MIARFWAGRTNAADADRYLEYLRRTGVAAQRATPGNLRSTVLRRIDGDEAEFIVLSFWGDIEDVRRFAGDDPERAVYYPEDREFLVEMQPSLSHYEVAIDEGTS